MKAKIFNIQYDTDGRPVKLPKTLIMDIPNGVTDTNEIEEMVVDFISDETGYCHFGFNYKLIDTKA